LSDLSIDVVLDEPVDSARRREDLVLLTTTAMRARRHPWAIVAMWAWQTALALFVGWPAAGLAHAAWSGDPHGDATLWAPGGYALVDWLWHDARGLSELGHETLLVLVVASVAGLVPTAAAMIAIAYVTRDRKAAGLVRSLAGGMRAFRPMVLLLALVTFLQALVVGAGAVLASGVEGWVTASAGESRAQQIEGLVLLVFVGLASGLGVAHDLARAAVVRFRVGGLRAFALGAKTLRLYPLSLWWSWAWRALASVAPVFAVGAVAGRIGGKGGFDLVFLALMHQAVVFVRVALRQSWLARALRGVDGALRRVR
jgi:hypothetical protein